AVLMTLGGIVLWARRRVRGAAAPAAAVLAVAAGSTAQAQTLQNFSVVGSTPVTSIPAGQVNENANSGPDKLFDDTILDESNQIMFDMFNMNYTDPDLFPGGFLGQYAIGGETPGAPDSAVVFMDYGAPVTASWFAY